MNPIANYASVLEVVFALNAVTYFYSIEPRRRGELLALFREFQRHIPDFSRRDRDAIRGYVILANYGVAHFLLTAPEQTIEVRVQSVFPVGLFQRGRSQGHRGLSSRNFTSKVRFLHTDNNWRLPIRPLHW